MSAIYEAIAGAEGLFVNNYERVVVKWIAAYQAFTFRLLCKYLLWMISLMGFAYTLLSTQDMTSR